MLSKWRWYTLERQKYELCLDRIFTRNLNSLYYINTVLAVMVCLFAVVPIFVEKNLTKGIIFIVISVIAIIIRVLSAYLRKRAKSGLIKGKGVIYALIIVYYTIVVFFGSYISVLTVEVDQLAITHMSLVVCALFAFVMPTQMNIIISFSGWVAFSALSFAVKSFDVWIYDMINSLVAVSMSVIFSWIVTMLRITSESKTIELEDERNKYFDQSTVDELTQLKNRRDYDHTIQRYLTNYRESDIYIFLALIDIDCFKNYNDYYGHPKGDECLRAVGGALNEVVNDLGVYAARVGGEEFALIWFDKDKEGGRNVISQVQRRINDLNIPHIKSTAAERLTISIGVQVMRCGMCNNNQEIYSSADNALYEAKRNGRNRAVVFDENKQFEKQITVMDTV